MNEYDKALSSPFDGLNITSLVVTRFPSTLLREIKRMCLEYEQPIRLEKNELTKTTKVYCLETDAILWLIKGMN